MSLLYDLTPITGQSAQDRRTTIVFGRVVERRFAWSAGGGLLAGLCVGAILSVIMGAAGYIVGALAGIGVVIMLTVTTNRGLKVRLWRSLYNKAKSNNGKPMRIHGLVDTSDPDPMRLVPSLSSGQLASLGYRGGPAAGAVY
jgi:hypothetical protein